MNLFAEIDTEIRAALTALQGQGKLADDLDMSLLTVEPPRDASHGHMATNAAMVLAKAAEMKPRDLAELLVEEVLKSDLIEAAEIAGPGFVNLRLDKAAWHRLVPHILHSREAYGDGEGGDKVNVEYVSANPTGPMHVGHARGAVAADGSQRTAGPDRGVGPARGATGPRVRTPWRSSERTSGANAAQSGGKRRFLIRHACLLRVWV